MIKKDSEPSLAFLQLRNVELQEQRDRALAGLHEATLANVKLRHGVAIAAAETASILTDLHHELAKATAKAERYHADAIAFYFIDYGRKQKDGYFRWHPNKFRSSEVKTP